MGLANASGRLFRVGHATYGTRAHRARAALLRCGGRGDRDADARNGLFQRDRKRR